LPTAPALTVNRAVPEVEILAGLTVAVSPGEAASVRNTVFEKTLPATIVMLEVPVTFGSRSNRAGLSVIAKSCFSSVTATVTTAE